jgi:hypothetical protein
VRDGTVEGGGAETAGGFRAEDVSFGTDAPVPIIAKCQGRMDNKTAIQKEYVLNHLNFQQVNRKLNGNSDPIDCSTPISSIDISSTSLEM